MTPEVARILHKHGIMYHHNATEAHNWEAEARGRVEDDPLLFPWHDQLFAPMPIGDGWDYHMEWICTTRTVSIVEWCHAIARYKGV